MTSGSSRMEQSAFRTAVEKSRKLSEIAKSFFFMHLSHEARDLTAKV